MMNAHLELRDDRRLGDRIQPLQLTRRLAKDVRPRCVNCDEPDERDEEPGKDDGDDHDGEEH